ncbi:hypothetical protein BHM03_00050874 [Ensete ventricosum]|nr:hypothetical protein BHM03_00050874 [Ensete ventricosum]
MFGVSFSQINDTVRSTPLKCGSMRRIDVPKSHIIPPHWSTPLITTIFSLLPPVYVFPASLSPLPLSWRGEPAQASNCLLPTSRRITSLTDPKLLLRFPCVLSPPHVLPTPQPWPTNYDPFASSSLSSLAFFRPFLFRSSGGGSPAMLSSNDNVLSYPPAVVADRRWKPIVELAPNCPRCHSSNTKFCYYNNYSLSQPRYFCKGCRRYWTKGGSLRNVPVGGGCRKSRRAKSTRPSTVSPVAGSFTNSSPPLLPCPIRPDLMLNEMVSDSCMARAATIDDSTAPADGSTIDLQALYAKYSNQRPQTEPGPVTAESQLAEGDHEPMGSVGTSSESSSCNQVFSQPMEEEEEEAAIALLSQVDPPYNIEHSCLPVDLTATVEWPMQPVTNYVSLDCPGASGLIYEEFESVAVGGMHHQQSPLNDDWSLPDYSSLEPFYRC